MTRARRAAAVLFVVLAALGLAACGNDPSDNNATTPASSPTAAASAVASTQASRVSIVPGDFSGEAVTVFGKDKVQAGYKEMAEYTSQQSFRRELLQSKPTYTVADFASAREKMTDRMRSDWDPVVGKAVAGDQKAQGTVRAVMYYDLTGEGYELAKTGPLVVNESVSSPTVSVERNAAGVQRLVVSFSHHGELRYTNNGNPVRVAFDKTATYNLVPAPAGSTSAWLIDGVMAKYKSGSDIPDTPK